MGGKCRDDLTAYASGGWAPAANIGEQLAEYVEDGGFRAVKMRVGSADGDTLKSAQRVEAARKYLGDDIDIMVDAHGTFTCAEA